jgi:hypothetical protein
MLTFAVLTAATARFAEPEVVLTEGSIVTLPRPSERGEISLEEAAQRGEVDEESDSALLSSRRGRWLRRGGGCLRG